MERSATVASCYGNVHVITKIIVIIIIIPRIIITMGYSSWGWGSFKIFYSFFSIAHTAIQEY